MAHEPIKPKNPNDYPVYPERQGENDLPVNPYSPH